MEPLGLWLIRGNGGEGAWDPPISLVKMGIYLGMCLAFFTPLFKSINWPVYHPNSLWSPIVLTYLPINLYRYLAFFGLATVRFPFSFLIQNKSHKTKNHRTIKPYLLKNYTFLVLQGLIQGYPSRVRVGRGCVWGHFIIWAGAVRPETAKNKKSKGWQTNKWTNRRTYGPTKRGVVA